MDGVLEVAVWGRYSKEIGDTLVEAGVVLTGTRMVSEEEVVKHVAGKLTTHKQITGGVHFLDKIPHNPQGKKLRKFLKEKYSK